MSQIASLFGGPMRLLLIFFSKILFNLIFSFLDISMCLILCDLQGALETIQEKLVDLPAAYVETYKKYTRQGSRVLALAYKLLPEMPVSFC